MPVSPRVSGTVGAAQPGWRNGIRDGLKHHCPKGLWVRIPHPVHMSAAGDNVVACRTFALPRSSRARCAPPTAACVTSTMRGSTASPSRRSAAGAASTNAKAWTADRHTPAFPAHAARTLPINAPAYAELLGWYLGDGYISQGRRGVYNLHIYNDAQYPRLNAHVAELMRRVKPGGRPHTRGVAGLHRHDGFLEALALPLPPARPRTQARAADRPRRVAAEDRRRAPVRLPSRPLPLRRLSRQQLGDPHGRRTAKALRLWPLDVRESFRRHSRPLHSCSGRRRDPMASPAHQLHRRLQSRRRTPPGRADRVEGLASLRGHDSRHRLSTPVPTRRPPADRRAGRPRRGRRAVALGGLLPRGRSDQRRGRAVVVGAAARGGRAPAGAPAEPGSGGDGDRHPGPAVARTFHGGPRARSAGVDGPGRRARRVADDAAPRARRGRARPVGRGDRDRRRPLRAAGQRGARLAAHSAGPPC